MVKMDDNSLQTVTAVRHNVAMSTAIVDVVVANIRGREG